MLGHLRLNKANKQTSRRIITYVFFFICFEPSTIDKSIFRFISNEEAIKTSNIFFYIACIRCILNVVGIVGPLKISEYLGHRDVQLSTAEKATKALRKVQNTKQVLRCLSLKILIN